MHINYHPHIKIPMTYFYFINIFIIINDDNYSAIIIILFIIMSLKSSYNLYKILKFVYLYILFLNFNAPSCIKVLCFLLNSDFCFIILILFIFYVFIFEQIHPSIIFQFFQFLFS